MIINIHAGHNPDGKTACGAIGFIKESTEARKVKDAVIERLRHLGHTVYDCTCDNGSSQNDVLKQIVNKCNQHPVDLDVSIHFNAGGGEGVEVLIYNDNSKAKPYASKIAESISMLGFKNRGVKVRNNLFVLRTTKSPSLLVECCFCDNKNDVAKYSVSSMANAIVNGIIIMPVDAGKLYRVQVGAFRSKDNAIQLANDLISKGYKANIVEGGN